MRLTLFCVCAFKYFADADDALVWIAEKLVVASSDDIGKDEASAQSLLKKHKVS
jgi:spectrin beta